MDQTPPPRLPAQFDSAAHRVRLAARAAAEQTVDSLGLAALSTHGVMQRDALLGAQYELNRKLALFSLTFDEALDTDIARQLGTLVPTTGWDSRPCPTPDELVASWDTLSLVDDHEVELHLSADRFAREIGLGCEWEIRELDAYVASLMHLNGGQHDRNPLRAEVIGQALVHAVEAISERPEVRKVLCTEIGRALAQMLRQTFGEIVDDLRAAGIKPMGLTVRHAPSRGTPSGRMPLPGGEPSGHGALPSGVSMGRADVQASRLASLRGWDGDGGQTTTVAAGMPSGFARSTRGMSGPGANLGQVDPGMMALIRRLSRLPAGPDDSGDGEGADHDHDGHLLDDTAPAAANLILAHRETLREAATGALDRMVIDVVGELFEQILADAKVAPQVARQIARLQLPVLRAALGDASFFSSRRHPVRRFVNRLATLGCAVDDFASDEGRALLELMAALVGEVVEGDFEQIALYEQKLAALEEFSALQAAARLKAEGDADRLLAHKETELRVQRRFAQDLDGALGDLPLQDYLRHFLATTWSKVIASAELHGADGDDEAQRLRDTARELVMSVQPKGTPALRQAFLQRLPPLMRDLNQGLDRIACTDEVRREFFGRLLPAHAESLKGQPLSTLEMNLLSRQLEAALGTPVPQPATLPPAAPAEAAALREAAGAATLTPDEARAVGLVDERSVDWNGQVDIDLGAEPEVTAVDIDIAGLPPPEAPEPTRGKSLADHVQIGFAYRMHLEGAWHTVRASYISAARSFFVFSHGAKGQRSVSLTWRMLSRLCEAGRFTAVENAYLIERATARARRQLAGLLPRTANRR